jgi:hypothetical protein
MVMTDLETSKYFQGMKSVNEYMNEFCEMIDQAQYFEGAYIMMKFRQGLNSGIQDQWKKVWTSNTQRTINERNIV